jgi:signal transduction histidine kinase
VTGHNGSAVAVVLTDGGEMGALMRSIDWTQTALGPVSRWPQSLRTTVSTCLSSRFPICVWWGPELVMLYNDAYRPVLGTTKHPRAMGRRGREMWPEIWHIIGPMLEGVLTTGEATWSEDILLPIDRRGFTEECYFTFSYSPIRDESGGIGGIFTAVSETTGQVLSERRLRTLRDLPTKSAGARTVESACSLIAEALEQNLADVPFSRLYLLEEGGQCARRVASTGLAPEETRSPERVSVASEEAPDEWSLGAVLRTGQAVLQEGLGRRFGLLSAPGGGRAPDAALVLPVMRPGEARPVGALVTGVSPRLLLDEKYRGFLELVAGQVATILAGVQALQEAQRRAEALAELDRAKTAFFSNVSHEFRTPLTLMLAPLEEALARPEEGLRGEELHTVHRNSLRLLKLVNTLLDFSRIEAGRAQASFEPVELGALTADLASSFRSAVERAGLRFTVECPPLPEPAWVDRELWEKIVFNLLSNAFKFTFEGEIAVHLRQVEDRIELSIRDTGTGIPPEELPRVFERFHRVQGARGRSFEGTGIGLALVQEVARLHGGAVRAESTVGHGSTFTVSVPLGTAHLPPERLRAPRTLASTALGAAPFLEEVAQWSGEPPPLMSPGAALSHEGPLPGGSARLEAPSGPPSGRILVADDNADMRNYLARILQGRWTVEAVSDGAAALEAARRHPPDLVLSDVMMPGLDGFGLLRELRVDPRTRAVPVILLSARAGEEATTEGLQAGASDYLTKPFSARELLARVEGTVKTARVAIENARLYEEAKRRTEFEQQLIGIVSHDLRNPIGAILLSANALLKREELSARAAQNAARIISSAERAHRLIRDLLDFTQARLGGGIPIERRPLDFHEATRQALEEVEVTFPERRILLEQEGDGQGEWDVERLGQVVQNLVTNALRYSAPKTPVRVSTRGAEAAVLLEVHNQGPPIAPERIPHLFQAMTRGTQEVDHATRSVGLGLFIVDQVVRAHGGTIEVSSTEAEGTCVTVRLPRSPASSQQHPRVGEV